MNIGDNIVVIGAGIAGLSFAAALVKRGISCKVYEKDESFDARPGGYSLTIQQTGQKALQDLGLKEELFKLKNRCASYHTLNYSGKTITKEGRGKKHPTRGNVPIPRQLLRKWFINLLPKNTIIWGEEFKNISLNNEEKTIEIEFKSGNKIKTNFLICADGTFSNLRKQLSPNPPLKYLGYIAINGIGKLQNLIFKDCVTQWLDGKHRIFTKPFEDDSIMWQLTFAINEENLNKVFSINLKKSDIKQIINDSEKKNTKIKGKQ